MQTLEARIGQLVRWNAKKGREYVRAITVTLTPEGRERLGSVYGVIAVDGEPRQGDAVAAFIEDALVRSVDEAMRRTPKQAPLSTLFQALTIRANQSLARLFDGVGMLVSPEKIRGAVIAQRGLDLSAACWGQPSLLLFHPQGSDMTVIDLLAESDEERTPYNPAFRPASRGFTNLISGTMAAADRLVVATRDLREVLGDERLRLIISSNDPEAATAVLRDMLAPAGDAVAIAVLVADAGKDRAATTRRKDGLQPTNANQTQRSIDRLLGTASGTEAILSPSPVSSIIKTAGAQVASAAKTVATAVTGGTPTKGQAPNAYTERAVDIGARMEWTDAQPRPLFPRTRIAARTIASWVSSLRRAISSSPIPRPLGSPSLPLSAPPRTRLTTDDLIGRFNVLAPRTKWAMLASLLCAFILSNGAAAAIIGKRAADLAAEERRDVLAIEQKIDSSEASLIYRDEDRARRLLAEAEASIALLPEKNEGQRKRNGALRDRASAARVALRRAVALPAPEILTSITTMDGDPVLAKLEKDGAGNVWLLARNGDLFVARTKGTTEKLATGIPSGAALYPERSGVLVLGSAASAHSADGTTAPRTVDWKGEEPAIDGIAAFASRLYVLDAAHNRIIRLAAAKNGYGAPQFYLKDGTDLSGAVSIAIDGSVYVLNRNGEVVKLEKGLRQPFAVGPADPPVTTAKRVRTDERSEFLYVLDGDPARVLKFNKKTGTLVAQYVSTDLAGAQDFLVDESAGTISASVGNRLLAFPIPEEK